MIFPLRDAFDDLVTHVPAHVVRPDLAERAYEVARGRRTGRVLSALGAVAAVLIALVAVVPEVRIPSLESAGSDTAVDGYPRRIDHQWLVRDMPNRPGPVAALLQVRGERSRDMPLGSGWYAVAADGHHWRLPQGREHLDTYPTLSPNGRRIGFPVDDNGPFVVHDLVSGERVEFDEIGNGRSLQEPREVNPFTVTSQSPGFWSPDGSKLLLHGGRSEPEGGYRGKGIVIDLRERSVRLAPWMEGGTPQGGLERHRGSRSRPAPAR